MYFCRLTEDNEEPEHERVKIKDIKNKPKQEPKVLKRNNRQKLTRNRYTDPNNKNQDKRKIKK